MRKWLIQRRIFIWMVQATVVTKCYLLPLHVSVKQKAPDTTQQHYMVRARNGLNLQARSEGLLRVLPPVEQKGPQFEKLFLPDA